MNLDSLDWKSFWDLATPEQGAAFLRDECGAGAAAAAAISAVAAMADGRADDAHFWNAVQAALHPR